MDEFSPLPGKCYYWREQVSPDDLYDSRLQKNDWRVQCSCFVEGKGWTYTVAAVPSDCPDKRRCRYYIQHW